jgi:cellulose synthase/poly-beta-1,6-N-acetylglucosamine synthase-like glycosyltransferase
MARDIINLDNFIIDILVKRQLINVSQIDNLNAIKVADNFSLLQLIRHDNIIDNENLLEIIHQDCNVELLDNASKLQIINYNTIEQYIQNGYFIYKNCDNKFNIAINNIAIIDRLPQLEPTLNNKIKITLIKKHDFNSLLERDFRHLNLIKSKYFLEFISNSKTAKNLNYFKAVAGFCIIFFFTFFKFINIFYLVNNISYFLQNCLKIFLFSRSVIRHDRYKSSPDQNSQVKLNIGDINTTNYYSAKIVNQHNLPIYTILVPLYKEIGKLRFIINNIESLEYPKHRLDVKIIVEEDDYFTIKELLTITLPSYIQIIKVPFSLPRTKPKALNYSMQYVQGQYLVIYDAEDKPDPGQLLKAIAIFQNSPPECACLQAKLNFYNQDENLLTKLFSIEYSFWFVYILKGLDISNLPVTLGGTSNHFKVDILRKIGYWDSYNVTEDADLGIRLYADGYKVRIIDSYTLEEAPITLDNWINQRARWIKGFIQTFLVFLMYSDTKLTLSQKVSLNIFVGLSTYSFFCLPFLILTSAFEFEPIIHYFWLVNSFFALSYSYYTAFYILYKQHLSLRNFKKLDILGLLLWPFYFILHSIASYIAIYEIITKPFKWNKTRHGVSSLGDNIDNK